MDLLKLQYFLCVAESPSMQKAAEAMNVSQSTLSLAIKHLEQEFGLALFRRDKYRLELTEAGKTLQTEAASLLVQAENIKQQMLQFREQRAYRITIATEAQDFTAEAEIFYHQYDPNYRTVQHIPLRNAVKPLLQSGRVDFAVTLFDDTDDQIESQRLFQEPLLLLVNEAHPLSQNDSISFRQIQWETLIALPEGYAFRFLCESFFSMNGIRVSSVHEVRDPDLTARAVRGGFGVGFVPRCAYLRSEEQVSHVKALSVNDRFCGRQVYLTRLKQRPLSVEAQVFYDFLLDFGAWVRTHGTYPTQNETFKPKGDTE